MSQELSMILAALAIYAAGVMSPGPSFTLVTRLAASGARRAALGATLGLLDRRCDLRHPLHDRGACFADHPGRLADDGPSDRRGAAI